MEEAKARRILKQGGMSDDEIDDFIDGCKKGIKAAREGRVQSWNQVKKELEEEGNDG